MVNPAASRFAPANPFPPLLTRRKQKKFLTKWITEHMDEAEANIHKPLLLEEFGKIVWEKDYGKGYIEKKRNPVYEAMTGVTMDSVKKCGSLPCACI